MCHILFFFQNILNQMPQKMADMYLIMTEKHPKRPHFYSESERPLFNVVSFNSNLVLNSTVVLYQVCVNSLVLNVGLIVLYQGIASVALVHNKGLVVLY